MPYAVVLQKAKLLFGSLEVKFNRPAQQMRLEEFGSAKCRRGPQENHQRVAVGSRFVGFSVRGAVHLRSRPAVVGFQYSAHGQATAKPAVLTRTPRLARDLRRRTTWCNQETVSAASMNSRSIDRVAAPSLASKYPRDFSFVANWQHLRTPPIMTASPITDQGTDQSEKTLSVPVFLPVLTTA